MRHKRQGWSMKLVWPSAHLDDIAHDTVGGCVGLLDGGPLTSQSQLLGLEQHVRVLTTRDLRRIQTGGRGRQGKQGGDVRGAGRVMVTAAQRLHPLAR